MIVNFMFISSIEYYCYIFMPILVCIKQNKKEITQPKNSDFSDLKCAFVLSSLVWVYVWW